MEDIDDIGVKPSSTRSLRGARTNKPASNLRSKAKSSERDSESETTDVSEHICFLDITMSLLHKQA